jgi:2C-methyl-D-erythritol 2,4-cyclodiphosphate synthase
LLKTKLPINFARSSKRGNDGSLLEIKEEEELWVGNVYLSNEKETKGKSDLMNHRDVYLHSCCSP